MGLTGAICQPRGRERADTWHERLCCGDGTLGVLRRYRAWARAKRQVRRGSCWAARARDAGDLGRLGWLPFPFFFYKPFSVSPFYSSLLVYMYIGTCMLLWGGHT